MKKYLMILCLMCGCITNKAISTKTFYNYGDNYWSLYCAIETNKTALLYDPSFKYDDIVESESMKKTVSQFLNIDFSTNTYIKLNRKRRTITICQEFKKIEDILSIISEPYEIEELWVSTNTPIEDMKPYILTNTCPDTEYVGFPL